MIIITLVYYFAGEVSGNAALAAGEFQDDAPAVEAAPVQEAPAQPIFAGA